MRACRRPPPPLVLAVPLVLVVMSACSFLQSLPVFGGDEATAAPPPVASSAPTSGPEPTGAATTDPLPGVVPGGVPTYDAGSATVHVSGAATATLRMPSILQGERNDLLGVVAVFWETGGSRPSYLAYVGVPMVGTVTTAPGNGVILYVEGSPQIFATSDNGECTIEFTKADADDIEGSLTCEHVKVAAGGHVDFDATFWAT